MKGAIIAPKWKRWLAMRFGDKIISEDRFSERVGNRIQGVIYRTTAYRWRGILYVTHFEKVITSS